MRKVCCGAQFSVVLAFDGHVYTFGQGVCWIYLSTCRLFHFCLASFWSSIRASDWPAGFHAEEQIQPPGGPVPGGPVHRGHCCGLRTCAGSVLHWRRLRLGLQQRGTGEAPSFLIPAAEHRQHLTSHLFLWIQLGFGHCNPVKEPTLITALQGKNVKQISAGRCHSSAWTAPSTSKSSGTSLGLVHACI